MEMNIPFFGIGRRHGSGILEVLDKKEVNVQEYKAGSRPFAFLIDAL